MNEFFKKPVVKILMLKGEKGDKGNTGTGTPKGGKTGQYLLKKSDADYDYVWSPITTVSWDNVSGKTNATTSASGLMSAEDKSKLDNLQVGGRNLYYLKDFSLLNKAHISAYSVENGEIILTASGSDMYFGEVISTGGTYEERRSPLMYVEGASFVTVSISNNEFNNNYFNFLDKDKKPIANYTPFESSKITISVPSGAVYITLRIGKGDAVPGTTYKTRVKVERGTVATDWTPALEDVDSRIDALNSVTKSFTLSAASWSDWTQSISDSLITATSNQEVLPAIGISKEQLIAFQKAMVVDAGQEAGKLTLRVMGTLPTIDIPIRIIFRGTI